MSTLNHKVLHSPNIIAVSAGSGGHAGTMNPVALINEIRPFFDKTMLRHHSTLSVSELVEQLQQEYATAKNRL